MHWNCWVVCVWWQPLFSLQAGSGIESLRGAVNAGEEPGAVSNIRPLFTDVNHAAI